MIAVPHRGELWAQMTSRRDLIQREKKYRSNLSAIHKVDVSQLSFLSPSPSRVAWTLSGDRRRPMLSYFRAVGIGARVPPILAVDRKDRMGSPSFNFPFLSRLFFVFCFLLSSCPLRRWLLCCSPAVLPLLALAPAPSRNSPLTSPLPRCGCPARSAKASGYYYCPAPAIRISFCSLTSTAHPLR